MTCAACLGYLTAELGRVLTENRPSVILVQGDTNGALAGALAGNATGVPIVHIETGLRSHDWAMPEEHNRILTDHLTDASRAATKNSAANLRTEGVPEQRIVCTGNTIVEAVRAQLPQPDERPALLTRYRLWSNGYLLAAINRPENIENPGDLGAIQLALNELAATGIKVVFPMHPRTVRAVCRAGYRPPLRKPKTIPPVGARAFLALAADAAVLISDSGGWQKKSSSSASARCRAPLDRANRSDRGGIRSSGHPVADHLDDPASSRRPRNRAVPTGRHPITVRGRAGVATHRAGRSVPDRHYGKEA